MRRPLPHRPIATIALAALLGALAPSARGADLHTLVGVDAGGLRGRVVLADLRVAGSERADDRFDLAIARAVAAESAVLAWRRTAVAGPIGNLVLEGALGVGRAAPDDGGAGGLHAGVELGARGVAGPVALAVRAAYGNRQPFAWPELTVDAIAAPPADPRARTATSDDATVLAATVSATWRVDRTWTLSVAPTAARTGAAWTGSLEAALRRYAVGDDLDVSIRLDAAAGGAARHAALGATLHHAPRRAPESRATLWVGLGDDGFAPGAEVAWHVRAGASEAGIAAGWAPFWSDRPAGYAALQASAPMASGRGRVALAWTGSTWLAELGWSQALPR